jgi:hypothetical protein
MRCYRFRVGLKRFQKSDSRGYEAFGANFVGEKSLFEPIRRFMEMVLSGWPVASPKVQPVKRSAKHALETRRIQ